uniref:LisH domain-containing protein n=1 Tax=Anopheles maculatus TaxID=74869 RepID=A0A182SXL5_9DIPT
MNQADPRFQRDVAIMVCEYLTELGMKNVADQFAAGCPLLNGSEPIADRDMPFTIPIRNLHDAMLEFNKQKESLGRIIQEFQQDVPMPLGTTNIVQIQSIIDHFQAKATTHATGRKEENMGVVRTTVSGVDNIPDVQEALAQCNLTSQQNCVKEPEKENVVLKKEEENTEITGDNE